QVSTEQRLKCCPALTEANASPRCDANAMRGVGTTFHSRTNCKGSGGVRDAPPGAISAWHVRCTWPNAAGHDEPQVEAACSLPVSHSDAEEARTGTERSHPTASRAAWNNSHGHPALTNPSPQRVVRHRARRGV